MKLNAESEFASRVRASCPRKHSDSLPAKHSETIAALLKWAPLGTLLAMFGDRITAGQVYDWRRGKSRPAPWIMAALADRLEQEAKAKLELAAKARSCAGPGKGWNKGAKTLAVWRAKQAEEREAKKKAAELAALHDPD